MNRIKRLLDRPTRADLQNGNDARVARLPTELLVVILQYVWDFATLAALCRTNKRFLTITQPLLYNHLSVPYPYPGKQMLTEDVGVYLFRILRHTRLSDLVVSLTIELNPNASCNPKSRNKCRRCDKQDARLGKTLVTLSSLKHLDLFCGLCSSSRGRHMYLSRLNQQLSSFKLTCDCHQHHYADVVELLSSHLVNSVTALALGLGTDDMVGSQSILSDALQQPTFLPNLKTMGQDGSILSLLIMARWPLERVGMAWYNIHPAEHFHTSLSAHPGSLRFLSSDLILDWSVCIRNFPEIYTNIIELGSFSFPRLPMGDSRVLDQLSFLGTLPNLQTIYINRKYPSSDTGYITVAVQEKFVHFLGETCQSLLRVRVGDSPWEVNDTASLLWERLSPPSEWVCHPLVSVLHTDWETIKGRPHF